MLWTTAASFFLDQPSKEREGVGMLLSLALAL